MDRVCEHSLPEDEFVSWLEDEKTFEYIIKKELVKTEQQEAMMDYFEKFFMIKVRFI